jgi:periplasmic protein TonB
MGAVVQAFPSIQGINGRSFALAFIIVVHAAFFWALTSGLAHPFLERMNDSSDFVPIDPVAPADPPPGQHVDKVDIAPVVPSTVDTPIVDYDHSGWTVTQPPTRTDPIARIETVVPTPVIMQPQIDTQRGLREPIYPAQEIRLGHTGTVLLAVEVLPNGKVGALRLVQSSGYPRLDEAAIKAAREWRLIPGTRDGMATAMWKQIPITLRLRE